MRKVFNKEGQVCGLSMDGITKPQRRRKERALFRLLFAIEKEQKKLDAIKSTFSKHVDVMSINSSCLYNMEREAYDLRSKLGIATDEQLESFIEKMRNEY